MFSPAACVVALALCACAAPDSEDAERTSADFSLFGNPTLPYDADDIDGTWTAERPTIFHDKSGHTTESSNMYQSVTITTDTKTKVVNVVFVKVVDPTRDMGGPDKMTFVAATSSFDGCFDCLIEQSPPDRNARWVLRLIAVLDFARYSRNDSGHMERDSESGTSFLRH
jgi:hypothetical protein